LPKSVSGFFTAGDVRANENIGLIALHTVFMREHNRLCDVFLAKNPKLTDEQLYQMARNYVVGLIQHITMDEYLLFLLGKTQFDAWVGNYTYQESVNPDLYTEFNSAAFRIGHSMINSPYKFMDNSGTVLKNLTLGEMF
jgi:peroxidase